MPAMTTANPDQVPRTCRQCRYNLTGLQPGPCPECGTTFDADEWQRRGAIAEGLNLSVAQAAGRLPLRILALVAAPALWIAWLGIVRLTEVLVDHGSPLLVVPMALGFGGTWVGGILLCWRTSMALARRLAWRRAVREGWQPNDPETLAVRDRWFGFGFYAQLILAALPGDPWP